MVDLRSTVDHVHRHPGMWFGRSDPTHAECAAFLLVDGLWRLVGELLDERGGPA